MSTPRKRRRSRGVRPLSTGPTLASRWGASGIRDLRVLDELDTAPMSMDLLAPRQQHQFGKSCDRGGANYRTSTAFDELDRRIGA